MDATECYENENNNVLLHDAQNIANIAGHSYVKHNDPLEAASQEFDQIDIHRNGELDWDQFCRIVIKGFSDMAWIIR